MPSLYTALVRSLTEGGSNNNYGSLPSLKMDDKHQSPEVFVPPSIDDGGSVNSYESLPDLNTDGERQLPEASVPYSNQENHSPNIDNQLASKTSNTSNRKEPPANEIYGKRSDEMGSPGTVMSNAGYVPSTKNENMNSQLGNELPSLPLANNSLGPVAISNNGRDNQQQNGHEFADEKDKENPSKKETDGGQQSTEASISPAGLKFSKPPIQAYSVQTSNTETKLQLFNKLDLANSNAGYKPALFIGVYEQDDKSLFLERQTMKADANFASILFKRLPYKFKMDKNTDNQYRMLTGNRATFDRLDSGIGIAIKALKNKDTLLLLHYSGHGVLHEGELFWAPKDAKREGQYMKNLINVREVKNGINKALDELNSKSQIVIMSNACFAIASEHVKSEHSTNQPSIGTNREHVHYISSSDVSERSFNQIGNVDDDNNEPSTYMNMLMRVLQVRNGMLLPPDGNVDGSTSQHQEMTPSVIAAMLAEHMQNTLIWRNGNFITQHPTYKGPQNQKGEK